jgi:hypothetical protein
MILLATPLCNYGRGFCLIDVGTEGSLKPNPASAVYLSVDEQFFCTTIPDNRLADSSIGRSSYTGGRQDFLV